MQRTLSVQVTRRRTGKEIDVGPRTNTSPHSVSALHWAARIAPVGDCRGHRQPAGRVAAQAATRLRPAPVPGAALVPVPDIPDAVASPGNGTPAAVLGVDAATDAAIRTLVDSLAACLTAGMPRMSPPW